MATDWNGQYIYSNASTLALRLRKTFYEIEDLYNFLSGLTVDDLMHSAPAGEGLTQPQAENLKSCITELHDFAQKFYGQLGHEDAGLVPITLPHDYQVFVARLVGPRLAS